MCQGGIWTSFRKDPCMKMRRREHECVASLEVESLSHRRWFVKHEFCPAFTAERFVRQ